MKLLFSVFEMPLGVWSIFQAFEIMPENHTEFYDKSHAFLWKDKKVSIFDHVIYESSLGQLEGHHVVIEGVGVGIHELHHVGGRLVKHGDQAAHGAV